MRSQITPSPPIIDPYGQRLLDLLRLHECSLHRIRRHISLNLISYLRSGFKGFNTGNWIMGWTGRTSLHGPFGPLIHFLCSTFCSHALVLSIPSHPKNVHRKSQRIGPVNSLCAAHVVTLSDIHSSPLLDRGENKKIKSEVWTLSGVQTAFWMFKGAPAARKMDHWSKGIVNPNLFHLLKSRWWMTCWKTKNRRLATRYLQGGRSVIISLPFLPILCDKTGYVSLFWGSIYRQRCTKRWSSFAKQQPGTARQKLHAT